jgi:hypothetical protein
VAAATPTARALLGRRGGRCEEEEEEEEEEAAVRGGDGLR